LGHLGHLGHGFKLQAGASGRHALGHLGHVFLGVTLHLGHLGHVFLCDPNDLKARIWRPG
jgi:peptide methionine sulfoxide reductase MsrB